MIGWDVKSSVTHQLLDVAVHNRYRMSTCNMKKVTRGKNSKLFIISFALCSKAHIKVSKLFNVLTLR